MSKLNVCVIYGGNSSEHDVSVVSAGNIIKNMDTELYNVYKIFITKEGEWQYEGKSAIISPDSTKKAIIVFDKGTYEEIKIDVVFIALHGKNGEDGTVQGLLELAQIPYTGCGVLSSALCMDKAMAKFIFDAHGIPQVDWVLLTPSATDEEIISKVNDKFTYPVFVKPSNAGSSFGTAKVKEQSELVSAVRVAFKYDSKVLVEAFINAREIECAVMGNDNPEGAKLGEIVVKSNDFYDFDAKYKGGGCDLLVPAPVDQETEKKIREYAIKAYKAADCQGFSRVDFFMSKDDGKIYLNEINTIPGFTGGSLFPITWEATGITVKQTVTNLINLALKRGK
ncbi:MAG: D-alanine--D-alanine ligase [Clostridia bacterium]|nr:D-alanine--D-alanine ligase [Clostridia bacterium]